MADNLPVLKGRTQSVALEDLLQVVGVSRQCLCVETEDDQGRVLGSLWLKSGFVLSVVADGESGREAFKRFLANPRVTAYAVYRPRHERAVQDEPLGSIPEMLLDAALAADRSAGGDALAEIAAVHPQPAAAARPAIPSSAPSAPRRHRIVGFVSGKGGSGKTTVALNVGLALAEAGYSVLLVDADPLGGLRHSVLADPARGTVGIFDVMMGRAPLRSVVLPTRVPSLVLVPAGDLRPREARENVARLSDPGTWATLLDDLAADYPLVLVDLPAGLHGIPAGALGACTHALAVLEAEPLALRVLPHLLHALEAQRPREDATELAGIILNGVQFRSGVSIGVVQGAWSQFAEGLVLETTIPRDPAILEASARTVPVAFLDRAKRPPIASVFRSLAEDVAERIGIVDTVPAGEALPLL
jgi:chromosome partitioning protein